MKSIFQEIALEENGEYHSTDKSYFDYGLSRTPETKHHLTLSFRKHTIQIYYELGNYNLGRVECELSNDFKIPNLEIIVQSHFNRIFNKRKNILTVKSDDKVFNKFLENKFRKLGLEQIGRDHLFQPKIYLKKNGNKSLLVSEFHLEFPAKHKVIRPLIRLYESIVNYTLD